MAKQVEESFVTDLKKAEYFSFSANSTSDSLHEANLKRSNVYSDIAEIFLSFANLKATTVEIVRGVKLLAEAYSEDVDPKSTNELLNFYL